MYRQIVHFLQGQVLVRIECGCPERVLNLCGARGIPFWELTWESPVCLTLRAVEEEERAKAEPDATILENARYNLAVVAYSLDRPEEAEAWLEKVRGGDEPAP